MNEQDIAEGLAVMLANIGAGDAHEGLEPNPEHKDQYWYHVGYFIAKDQIIPEDAIAKVDAIWEARRAEKA